MRTSRLLGSALLASLLVVALPACSVLSSDTPPVPDSTLVPVLVDLHLAQERANLDVDTPPALRDSVLAHYGIAPAQYRAVIAYYSERPEAYAALYRSVIDTLQARRSRVVVPQDESEP
jgi:hypothetical protein